MPDIFTKDLTPSYKRVDAHMFDPRDLRLDPALSGRIDPPTEADIKQRVDDFLNPKVGQLQSLLIAKDDDGYPVIIDGHIRWMAALKITKDKQGPFDGVFKLKCTYFVGSPLERYIATIKANIRKEPTPADDGYNISRLVHNFSMSEEDVATKVYGKSGIDGKPDVAWVRERMAYAELVPEAKEALKDGRLKTTQISTLAKLTKTAQRDRIKSAGDGKITAAIIKGEESQPVNGDGQIKPRKLAELRSFWTPYAEQKKEVKLNRFASAHLSYLAGGDAEEYFRTVSELLG